MQPPPPQRTALLAISSRNSLIDRRAVRPTKKPPDGDCDSTAVEGTGEGVDGPLEGSAGVELDDDLVERPVLAHVHHDDGPTPPPSGGRNPCRGNYGNGGRNECRGGFIPGCGFKLEGGDTKRLGQKGS